MSPPFMATPRLPLSGKDKNNNPFPLPLPKTPYVHHKSVNGMPQKNNIEKDTQDEICSMFIIVDD
jgi:hypothetical protein